VDLKSNKVSTVDENRTSPIKMWNRLPAKIILYGGEEPRAWSVVISDTTGIMSATASAEDHAFVLFGACGLFPGAATGPAAGAK